MRLSTVGSDEEPVTDVELYETYCATFHKALVEGGEPFKGDLENETCKNIQAAFRAFDPNAE